MQSIYFIGYGADRSLHGRTDSLPTRGSTDLTDAANQAGQSEIVVTGTRIQSAGFNQPTPVTSVTADQLALSAPGSLSESLVRRDGGYRGGQIGRAHV